MTTGNIFPDNEAISRLVEEIYLNLALVAVASVMVLHVSIYQRWQLRAGILSIKPM